MGTCDTEPSAKATCVATAAMKQPQRPRKKQRHMKGKTIKQTRYTKAHEHKVSVCREALP